MWNIEDHGEETGTFTLRARQLLVVAYIIVVTGAGHWKCNTHFQTKCLWARKAGFWASVIIETKIEGEEFQY